MTSFVIPDISPSQLMQEIVNGTEIKVTDKGDYYLLELPSDPYHAIQKRMKLADIANLPPDAVGGQSPRSSWLMLDKTTTDKENVWFFANSTSVGNPELVLDRICKQLDLAGFNPAYYSEHDDEFGQIAGWGMDNES